MGQEARNYLEDMPHERVVWKIQRWGWVMLTLILLAALAGLFGHGPLGKAEAGQRNSAVWAEYDRLGRYQAPAVLKVHLNTTANTSLPAIWFTREFLERMEVEAIHPTPERAQASGDRVIYIFSLARTNEPTVIAFHVKPSEFGKTPVSLGLVGGPELRFSQFIYP